MNDPKPSHFAFTGISGGTWFKIGCGYVDRDKSIRIFLDAEPLDGMFRLEPVRRPLWRRIGDAVRASEILSLRFGRRA